MHIRNSGVFEIHQPTSGGKAGRGCNKTSTIQVRRGNRIVKQVRYTTDKPLGYSDAIEKALKWAKDNAPAGDVSEAGR